MSVAATTYPEVSIAIVRDPALVRTVRLVAASVARRADCEDSLIEEIRLAVGEACAVMIGGEEIRGPSEDKVELRIRTAPGRFTVLVSGRMESEDSAFEAMGLDPWALLHGLCDDLQVSDSDGVVTVTMSWPL